MAMNTQATGAQAAAGGEQKTYGPALAAVTLLFFMWGFITAMNDVLIPHLRSVFDLNITQGMLVQFAFFGAYFIGSVIYFLISITSGDPIAKIGYKNGLILGLVVSSVGCALFYEAAELQLYGFFLGALFCLGLGLTMLQIAANPYVAILGPAESASGRLNLAQAFNSFGTTVAPVLGGYLIFNYFAGDGGQVTVDSVKVPYLIIAGLFAALALFIKVSNLPAFTSDEKVESGAGAFKFPHLVFGMGAIFFYVGQKSPSAAF